MPKPELTPEEEIRVAIADVQSCMLENIEAARVEKVAQIRKEHARHALQAANSRLRAIQMDLMY